MTLKIVDPGEFVLTQITRVRFTSGVGKHVRFKTTNLSKTLLTHIAGVWFSVGVRKHVPLKIDLSDKCGLTNVTCVWSGTGVVTTHVVIESATIGKRCRTEVTYVRLLPRMSDRMSLEVIALSELLLANATNIRFTAAVTKHVSAEVSMSSVTLLTRVTPECLVTCMSEQVGI